MIEQHDQLDAALEGMPRAVAPEIEALVDLAAEVSAALSTWRLTPEQRQRIEERAAALFDAAATPLWRRLASNRARPALIGGAALALAAGLGIAVAVARGRRAAHPVPA